MSDGVGVYLCCFEDSKGAEDIRDCWVITRCCQCTVDAYAIVSDQSNVLEAAMGIEVQKTFTTSLSIIPPSLQSWRANASNADAVLAPRNGISR